MKLFVKKIGIALYFPLSFFILMLEIIYKRPVAISAPYFNEERLKDGYFRRIKAIDALFGKRLKIYLSQGERTGKPWIERPNSSTVIFYYNEKMRSHRMKRNFFVFLTGRLYCHSVYQFDTEYAKIPFLSIYLDVHGIVPEEELLQGNTDTAKKMNILEYSAVKSAKHLFVVTEAMAKHLKSKYGNAFGSEYTILPIYDKELPAPLNEETATPDTITVVYAGGCSKWQKIELMQQAIHRTADRYTFKICVPEPGQFYKSWKYGEIPESVTVESRTYSSLCSEVYPYAQYGFVLRDNIPVNNVACPTKLTEYFENGIIPVVLSPDIGDFKEMGMKYITLDELESGRLLSPAEYKKGILKNRELLSRYKKIYEEGCEKFKNVFA